MLDVERSNSLTDLAARIKTEHEGCALALQRGVQHAIDCGKLLIEAKKQLNKHGQWLPWLRDHCGVPERTAQHYMRLARNEELLKAKSANLADLTVEEAVGCLTPVAPLVSLSAFHTFVEQLELIHPGIVASVSPPGMTFPEDLTYEQWLQVGELMVLCFPGAGKELGGDAIAEMAHFTTRARELLREGKMLVPTARGVGTVKISAAT